MEDRDGNRLEAAIKAAEEGAQLLGIPLEKAKEFLALLRTAEVLRKPIDLNTVAEVKSYLNPPLVVHDVIIATLIVLGEDEKKLRRVIV